MESIFFIEVECFSAVKQKEWGINKGIWNTVTLMLLTCFPLEYVMQHWKEDFMFGYQFLNGCNPVLIRRCTEIPKKLPVTSDMVECSLERNLTLEEEVKVGLGVRLDSICSSLCSLTSTPCSSYISATSPHSSCRPGPFPGPVKRMPPGGEGSFTVLSSQRIGSVRSVKHPTLSQEGHPQSWTEMLKKD